MPSLGKPLPAFQDDNGVWRCGAKRKSGKGDGRCHRPVVDPPHRCYAHGGLSPRLLAKKEREAVARKAGRILETYGLPRTVDPAAALLEEIARTAGHIDWLTQLIRELDPEALAWGKSKEENVGASEFTGVNVTETAAISVWLELYHRERAHFVKVCAAALSAGIAERQVRLAEHQGVLIADVLRAVFADPTLGLSEGQRRAAPDVVRRHLAVVRSA